MSLSDIVLGLDLLNDIFVIIDAHPMLAEEDNQALARRVRAGDTQARDMLILHNLRLVVSIVKPYLKTHTIRTKLAQDMMHEGIIGMMTAVDRYNPDLGYRFSTYAVWWIREGIHRWYCKQTTVSISQHAFDHVIKIRQCQMRGIFDPHEIAAQTQIALRHIEYALSYMQLSCSSLDLLFADEEDQGLTLADCLLEDNIDEYELVERDIDAQAAVRRLLAVLKPSYRDIVRKLFGLTGEKPMSASEVAAELGISRQRVDQIYRLAKDQMRRAAEAKGLMAS